MPRNLEKVYPEMINLRIMRARRGYTCSELAKRAGVDRALISKYEGGYYKPHATTLKKLADALNCDVSEILN